MQSRYYDYVRSVPLYMRECVFVCVCLYINIYIYIYIFGDLMITSIFGDLMITSISKPYYVMLSNALLLPLLLAPDLIWLPDLERGDEGG
jgi:hypothetical protein